MAYVEPKSWIYLIKGCPCDRSYNNTLYFEDKREQWVYMRSLATHTFTDQYYQRYERGFLRIRANAEELYEINYMAFSNDRTFNPSGTPTNNQKIFYCFVDNIEYINKSTTEIHYTIDVMQTYMFDYTLGSCMVEREHTLTDTLYGNLVPEDIGCTEYEYHLLNDINLPKLNSTSTEYSVPLYSIMIEYMPNTHCINRITTLTPNTDPTDAENYLSANSMVIDWSPISAQVFGSVITQGEMRNNTYCGTRYAFLDIPPNNGTTVLASRIQEYMGRLCDEMLGSSPQSSYVFALKGLNSIFANQGQKAAIVNLTIVPRIFKSMPNTISTPYYTLDDAYTATFSKTYSLTKPTSFSSTYLSSSYTPKNNKMFSYPYSSIVVTDDNGNERQYLWEEFLNNSYNFGLQGVNVSTPTAIVTPLGYRGKQHDVGKMSVICSDFPTAKWTEDSYLSYIAQNKNAIIQQGAEATASIIASAMGTYQSVGSIRQVSGGNATTTSSDVTRINRSRTSGLPTSVIRSGSSYTSYDPKTSIQQNIYDRVPNEGGMISAASSLIGIATKLGDTAASPDPAYGSTNYSAIRSVNNLYGFKIYEQFPRIESAERIDNYFTLFGYAIKSIKIPNVKSQPKAYLRPHWNYIKNIYTIILPITEGNITRYVGTDVEEELQAIYDKGITFWIHGEEVGNYTLNNSPQI
ncbi:MAG: hypothetical protein J6S67_08055 [Methanobrevibacter sp.]|nr:hypothetical protein [Methanobrevibacter sp.]